MSDAATTKRGPYAPTKRRREEIARAVLDVVLESGHEAVTIAQVAERASVSEATMLYHFPSKDHLLVAALALSDRESMIATHADSPEASLSLDEFRATLAADTRDDPRLRLLLALKGAALVPGHPAADYLAERAEQQVAIFTALIARRQRDGFAHPALDPRRIAVQLLSVWDGLTNFWITDPGMDLADMLTDAYRRLAGENVMDARSMFRDEHFGL